MVNAAIGNDLNAVLDDCHGYLHTGYARVHFRWCLHVHRHVVQQFLFEQKPKDFRSAAVRVEFRGKAECNKLAKEVGQVVLDGRLPAGYHNSIKPVVEMSQLRSTVSTGMSRPWGELGEINCRL